MSSRVHFRGLFFRSPGHSSRGRTSHLQRALRFEALERRELLSAAGLTESASHAAIVIAPQALPAAAVPFFSFHAAAISPTLAAKPRSSKTPAVASSATANPSVDGFATPAGSSVPPGGALTPQQILAAYGINLLSQNGAGQTIAIVDAYDDPGLLSSSNAAAYATSDLHYFNAYYGLPDFGTPGGPTFTKLDQTGGTNYPGTDTTGRWESEEALDVEWAHAIAPMANIVLIEANSSIYASGLFKAVNTARNLAGVSVVSMSFYGAESSLDSAYDSVYFQTPNGHQGVTFVACSGDVGSPGGYPAYSTNVLAVGGTSLSLTGNNYGSETGWSGSGGGISQYDSQPSYQLGLVIHNGGSTINPNGMRTTPDVAFDADPNTGVAIYDSYNGGSSPWFQYGGTSLSAPCWAGLIALADQLRVANGLGTLDGPSQTLPRLYQLPAADFHDITSGTSTGSPNYSAGTGYDLVTGLGTPVANLLVPDLAGVSSQAASTTTTVAGNYSSGSTYGQYVTYTVTVASASGTPTGSVQWIIDGLNAGSPVQLSNGQATYSLTTLTAGSHTLTADYTSDSGSWANSNSTSYSQTVSPAPLTITAVNKTKSYGAALPSLTASYSGFVNGDTSASLTTLPTLSTTATAASSVSGGPYSITASSAVDANYTISYVIGSLTVTPVALAITANNQTKAYGAALPTLTAGYSGFVNGDTSASLTTLPTLTTTATAASSVSGGPYAITASGAVDPNYTISYVPGALSVTPVALSITANNQTKAYGAALPALTAGYSGFVNGDTAASLTTQPTLSTTATAASSVSGGPYAITASGAVDPNYTITYVAGSLTVTKVGLTITAANQTKAYGAALPALTASYSGFVNGDTSASLTTLPTLATTATAASSVSGGPYAITASGAVDANYTISYFASSLSVTPVALSIIANNQTKAYGAGLPALTASYSGFVNGDTSASLTTLPTLSTTATAASSVSGGPYSITASGAVDPNYTISYVAGSLSVTSVALSITAVNKTKVYGAALPALTATYSGFVNGDTSASLTTLPTLSTTATAASSVSGGPYAITASGAVDPNYTISYVAGALSVTPVALTITAANKTKAYGAALPALTASYSGFVNGDTSASLTTLPTLSTAATVASSVSGGPYAITANGAVDTNYTISYVAGSLAVTPVALTITAVNKTKAYGAGLPALTANYSGFVNGDTSASLTTLPTLSTTATVASSVSGGPYAITASGAVDANYTISYVTGALTVTPIALTITAANKTKSYGAALPVLTANYNGFVNGDTSASLTTLPTLSTAATVASSVSGGPYAITASGAVDPNYTISYVAGSLSVTPVALTITAVNKTKAYNAALPTLTASYSGFVNGDTSASLTTIPTLSTTATASSSAGNYPITASGAVDPNYSISYVAGTLTVMPDVPPVLAAIESTSLNYIGGNPAMPITSAITASDIDSTTLASATIWISGNYQSGEDVLAFTNTANISGSWNAATGTLTLTGSDTLANYQAALRAVSYQDTSANPSMRHAHGESQGQ